MCLLCCINFKFVYAIGTVLEAVTSACNGSFSSPILPLHVGICDCVALRKSRIIIIIFLVKFSFHQYKKGSDF